MDPRLLQASLDGDLAMLRQLLQQDKLILISRPTRDNPLHIAAALGHADFAREILNHCPHSARQSNSHGLYPLHLASANGQLPVVKDLLRKSGLELCLLRDRDGSTPIHTAAIGGKLDVVAELADACPESLTATTYEGDSVLHLAVKSNCLDTTKYIVERINDRELINSKNERGDTALHLAVARKQLQTVKLLMSKETIDVNATNKGGFTALDVLLGSPSDLNDLALSESIRASNGKLASELWTHADEFITTPHHRQIHEDINPDTLMVVAALIYSITFNVGVNPPGGFNQPDSRDTAATTNDKSTPPIAGTAVHSKTLEFFLMFDAFGLYSSLIIILLLTRMVPMRRRTRMQILVWITRLAAFCTALTFQSAIEKIYIHNIVPKVLSKGWFVLLRITIVMIGIQFILHLLRWAGWMKRRGSGHGEIETRGSIQKIAVAMLVVIVLVAVVIANVIIIDF